MTIQGARRLQRHRRNLRSLGQPFVAEDEWLHFCVAPSAPILETFSQDCTGKRLSPSVQRTPDFWHRIAGVFVIIDDTHEASIGIEQEHTCGVVHFVIAIILRHFSE